MNNDPTRIPTVITALQRAWEGQPDLSLPALIGIVFHRGISWGCTDEELVDVLVGLQKEHPSLVTSATDAHYTFATTAPGNLVTIVNGWVVVRSGERSDRIPGLWQCSSLRPTGPGRPLVIADGDGIEHRLGVVTLVTAFDRQDAPLLEDIRREEIGNAQWLVLLEDGRRCVIGHRIRVWEQSRREVTSAVYSWQQISQCVVGYDFVVYLTHGKTPLSLGEVAQIVVLET